MKCVNYKSMERSIGMKSIRKNIFKCMYMYECVYIYIHTYTHTHTHLNGKAVNDTVSSCVPSS